MKKLSLQLFAGAKLINSISLGEISEEKFNWVLSEELLKENDKLVDSAEKFSSEIVERSDVIKFYQDNKIEEPKLFDFSWNENELICIDDLHTRHWIE